MRAIESLMRLGLWLVGSLIVLVWTVIGHLRRTPAKA
jgi:hypothetical protein